MTLTQQIEKSGTASAIHFIYIYLAAKTPR
jgi:hypothetical protein